MHKHTVHFVIFEAPGSFVAESFKREVAGPDPLAVDWPENAYAFRLFRREDVIDGNDTYTGKSVQIGKTYYHPDSKVETLAEVRANPKATPILISNMKCNGWEQIVWSRWGNWPQHFDAAESEVLPHGVPEVFMTMLPADKEALNAAYEEAARDVPASLAGPSPRLSDEAIAAAWKRAYPGRAAETVPYSFAYALLADAAPSVTEVPRG